MEKSELIKIIQDSAIEVMKEKKILASILIAESIRILYTDEMSTCYEDLIIGNNPMAVEAGVLFKGEKIYNEKTKVMYRTYDSLEEGIANYVSLHEEDKFNCIKEIFSYRDALNKLSSSFYNVSALGNYIMAYRLFLIDQKVLKQMYSGKRNVIETTAENETTLMMQRLAETHTGVGLNKTIAEVQREEEAEKSRIIDENNASKIFSSPTLTKGAAIKLHNANLYDSLKSDIPSRCITGEYYLADGLYKYHRYAIVMKSEYVGNNNMIMGYIDEDQLK